MNTAAPTSAIGASTFSNFKPPSNGEKMALTDEEESKLKAELEKKNAQLTELLAKAKTEEDDAKKEEEKRKKTKVSPAPAADPDTLKEIAQLKEDVAKLKEKQGTGVVQSKLRLNFFED